MEKLTEENLVLKHKLDSLEGIVQLMTFELQAAKAALGPWYRADTVHLPPLNRFSSELPSSIQPSSASTSQPRLDLTPPSFESPTSVSSAAVPPNILASYFPSEQPSLPTSPNHRLVTDQYNSQQFPPRPSHRISATIGHGWDQTLFASSATARPDNIAPLNLSTTLEGSLSGLRESLVTLAASVDSLGRRNDIALTNETLRLNEEVMSLRANIHGLRMQVRDFCFLLHQPT